MRLTRLVLTAFAVVACAAAPARAQRGIMIPDDATVQCRDGSWSTASTQRGACSRHQGVKRWIGSRPTNAAARCNDGAWWTNATLQGACSSHGGVYKSYRAAEKAEAKAEKREMKAERKEDRREIKQDRKELKRDIKEDRKNARP